MKTTGLIAGSFLALAMTASAALSATVTNVANATDSYTYVDLTATLALPAGADWVVGSEPGTGTGWVENQYRSPFEISGQTNIANAEYIDGGEELPFWYVQRGETAILDLASAQTVLSFLWGSVDSFNIVELWLEGTRIAQVFNTDLSAPDPLAGILGGASFVTIGSTPFDEVRFISSTNNAFEFSNVSAIPLPAGGVLLLTALGGLALARRRSA